MCELSHTVKYVPGPSDVDARGLWRFSSAQVLMQELAEIHASMFGSGRKQLLERGVVWVLARSRTQFEKEPSMGETVYATTYPGNTVRGLFPRYYEFTDENKKPIGAAVTLWLLVDAVEHKLAHPDKYGVALPKTDAAPPFPHPGRLRPKGEPTMTTQRCVRYSDLDINRHMNNARYIEWLFDAADTDRLLKGSVRAAQINYQTEAHHDELITLKRYDGETNCLLIGTAQDGRAVFEGELVLGEEQKDEQKDER